MPDLAKIAYEAYADFLRARGVYMDTWDDLNAGQRSAWDAAAQAVLRET